MSQPASRPLRLTAMIIVGLTTTAWIGSLLGNKAELAHPINPLGINRSPYGEVFAMAMQGPINTDFHVGMYGATPEEMVELQRENQRRRPPPGSLLIVQPDPAHATSAEDPPLPPGLLPKMQHLIERMRIGHARRTNPLPASDALKFHIRRSAEDKLRLAYHLDPSHYANYNALHFFLTEGIGTRPELEDSVDELAHQTIDYCLSRRDDPRPALTAAAACTNLLQLMFKQHFHAGKTRSLEEMQSVLTRLDESIERYERIAAEWQRNRQWQRLSPQRIDECRTRIRFITNIRNACAKTIGRIQSETEISS